MPVDLANNQSIKSGKMIPVIVTIIHVLALFGPYFYLKLDQKMNPKESAFKVKLMGDLSTGPEVGPPQRRPPSPNPPNPPGPEVPAPEVPVPEIPAPEPPAPTPAPAPPEVSRPVPQIPTPKRPVIKKPAVKKPVIRKPVVKKPAAAKPSVAKPAVAKPTVTKPNLSKNRRTAKKNAKPGRQTRPKNMKEAQSQVYSPPGGTNTNPMVPIGSRDLAQKLGPQNNATPGGGGSDEDAAYGKQVGDYLKLRWQIPPRSMFKDGNFQVWVELSIGRNGKILAARILKRSGNQAMDLSVEEMLRSLDRVPVPPKNREMTLQLIMLPEI